jgi:predicted DNA-binding transcriptional regulator YafY
VNRANRLYALVEEPRAVAPRPRSARWLAGRFEVSVRTVERDISALQQSGVPIYAQPAARAAIAWTRRRRRGTKPSVPRMVADALDTRRVLRLGYANREGAITVREIEPLGYLGKAAHWYLVAWCWLRDALRLFRTDRIPLSRSPPRCPRHARCAARISTFRKGPSINSP